MLSLWLLPWRMRVLVSCLLVAACVTPQSESGRTVVDHGVDAVTIAQLIQRTRLRFRRSSDGFRSRWQQANILVEQNGSVSYETHGSVLRLQTRGEGSPAIDRHGHVHIEHTEATELIYVDDEGLHQEWRYETRPQSVFVRIETSHRPTRTSERGLHFDIDDAALVYSHATWVDARGRRWHVPARWRSGNIELDVPGEVLAASEFPAVLDPTLGPEIPLDDPVPSLTGNEDGAISGWAWSGSVLLFTLAIEDRLDPDGFITRGVYAYRMSADGTILDPWGIDIAANDESIYSGGSVAWDGSNFMVVYTVDTRYEVFAKRVGLDGSVLDPSGVRIATEGESPQLAFADGRFVLVLDRRVAGDGDELWVRSFPPSDLGAGGLDGTLLSGTDDVASFRLASRASDVVLAWVRDDNLVSDDYRVYAMRIDEDGAALDAPIEVLPATADRVSGVGVATSSGRILVAWGQRPSGSPSDVYGQLLLADGTATGARISLATSAIGESAPDVAWTGTMFQAVWYQADGALGGVGDIYGRRVATDGSIMPTSPIAATDGLTEDTPRLAETSSGAIAFFRMRFGTPPGGHYVPIDGTGSVGPARPIERSNRQWNVDIARSSTGFLAVWEDDRGEERPIYGIRLDLDGEPIDAEAIEIGARPLLENLEPRVASDGTDYYVVWRGHVDEVWGRRVFADGTLGVEREFSNEPGARYTSADVDWNGSRYLVAYIERNTAEGQLLETDGSLDGSPFEISRTVQPLDRIRIAASASTFLVVWNGSSSGLAGRRVGGDGTVGDAVDIHILPLTNCDEPDATWAGSRWAVVGSCRGALTRKHIWMANVLTDGSVTPSVRLSTSITTHHEPSVAFDGTRLLSSWQEVAPGGPDVAGAIASIDGASVEPQFPISATAAWDFVGTAIGGAPNRFLAAYSRWGAVPQALRAHVRWIDVDATCTDDGDCPSGHCVDGLCCDTACGGGVVDCMACSRAAGAAADGTCGPLVTGVAEATVCRAATDACDVDDVCSTTSTSCGPDGLAAVGTPCRASIGACDAAEACDGSSSACPADLSAPDGTDCSDGVGCNGVEACLAGVCSAGTPLECDDGDACTSDRCEEPGTCVSDAVLGCCSEPATCPGAACLSPTCEDMACGTTPIPGCCTSDVDCDDGNSCTDDACDGSGTCTNSLRLGCCRSDGECGDGDPCTLDLCEDEACTSAPVPGCCTDDSDCDDGNACTADVCPTPGAACESSLIPGCCVDDTDCDDSDSCTIDVCTDGGGTCMHDPDPRCCATDFDCDDGNQCTTDSCVERSCVNAAMGCCGDDSCDDGDECTLDVCDGSACTHMPICEPGGGGCGCRATPDSGAVWLAIGVFLLLRRRR